MKILFAHLIIAFGCGDLHGYMERQNKIALSVSRETLKQSNTAPSKRPKR